MKEEGAAVIFFDLFGTLVTRSARGATLAPGAAAWMSLSEHYRLGVLCNAGSGRAARNLRLVLEEAGIYDHFTPELLVNASLLTRRLPDPSAFRVAAALAGVPAGRCVFVSGDALLRVAARAAGMDAEAMPEAAEPAAPPAARAAKDGAAAADSGAEVSAAASLLADAPADEAEEPAAAVLLAGEVDEDTGPTFVLEGRVVTMNGSNAVYEGGRVVVSRGKIAHVLAAGEPVPAPFASAPRVATGATIYPGLIDLHNHFVYNVLPLWRVPKLYANRTQWPRAKEYASNISLPIRALASYSLSSRAVVRYVEAKALAGGTTTGQGIRTRIEGAADLFYGAMRNVEETKDPRLPEASTRVPNLQDNAADIAAFRKTLERRLAEGAAYFYHLSEGTDAGTRRHYTQLAENDLLRASLVGIHSLALTREDLEALAASGAKVVWSPFSNLLLYGRTLDPAALKGSGVTFSLGCDWSPTGSKNLLQELKVARHVAAGALSARDLVRAVTSDAARVAGWQKYLGVLRRDAFADLTVIEGEGGDPYEHLIAATEKRVRLVVVHGVARYGDLGLMKELNALPDRPPEAVELGGVKKAFQFYAPNSGLNDMKLRDARQVLSEAMSDLPAFVEAMEGENAHLLSLGLDVPQPFLIELDNEYEPTPEESEAEPAAAELAADWDKMAKSVELDPLLVDTESYWEAIDAQANLADQLREVLKNAYKG